MNIKDLDKIILEYVKHCGKDQVQTYFKQLLTKKESKNATSKEKIDSSSRSN